MHAYHSTVKYCFEYQSYQGKCDNCLNVQKMGEGHVHPNKNHSKECTCLCFDQHKYNIFFNVQNMGVRATIWHVPP